MAARQTRRSVSVKGLTYQRIKKHCDREGTSVSGFLEEVLAEKLGEPSDEELQKFGEAMKSRHNGSEAAKADDKSDDFNATYTDPIKLF
jgi:hypothetical protein